MTFTIDIEKIFKDFEYKNLLVEYHDFVSYILKDINSYSIYSATAKFNEVSIIYKCKDEFIQMLKSTFPQFDVTFETSEQEDDLSQDEYSISVDWSRYIKERTLS